MVSWLLCCCAALCIAISSASIHKKQYNNLVRRQHSPQQRENDYNEHIYHSARTMSDFDKLLEEQEARDLYQEEESYANRRMRRRHGRYRHEALHNGHGYASRMFAGGDAEDTNADDEEGEGEGEEEEYSDKEQLTAFLLSFFMGWVGAGRLYVGDYAVGSIKLCMPLIICCVTCILLVVLKRSGTCEIIEAMSTEQESFSFSLDSLQEVGGAAIALCICSCGFCAMWIWYITDWILFALNEIPDSDGKLLYPM